MANTKITETVRVKVKSSQQEIIQAVIGSSISPMAKLFERYKQAIERFKNDGFTIVSEDIDKQSFVAEKKY